MSDIRQLLLATAQAQANAAKRDAASPRQQEPGLRADSSLVRQDITDIALHDTLAKTLSPVDKGVLGVTGKLWGAQLADRLVPKSRLVWPVCVGAPISRYPDTKPVLLQHCRSRSASSACGEVLQEMWDSQVSSHPPQRLDILQDHTACFITFANCNACNGTYSLFRIDTWHHCTCCETLCFLKCSVHAV